jgi:hypothetical protein
MNRLQLLAPLTHTVQAKPKGRSGFWQTIAAFDCLPAATVYVSSRSPTSLFTYRVVPTRKKPE